jgi:hypothetical protein
MAYLVSLGLIFFGAKMKHSLFSKYSRPKLNLRLEIVLELSDLIVGGSSCLKYSNNTIKLMVYNES